MENNSDKKESCIGEDMDFMENYPNLWFMINGLRLKKRYSEKYIRKLLHGATDEIYDLARRLDGISKSM